MAILGGTDAMGTILLAGIYGVGKSTLGEQLSSETSIPFFSAGDLISSMNGEQFGANKCVKDKNKNQQLLSISINQILNTYERILLAGHFCIFDKEYNVDILPTTVFQEMKLEKIILLEAPVGTICNHLLNRDCTTYPMSSLEKLKSFERNQAELISKKLSIPLFIYQMKFSDTDVSFLKHLIKL